MFKYALSASLLFLSTSLLASEPLQNSETEFKKHTIGAAWGFGDIQVDNDNDVDTDIGQTIVYYDYRMTEAWSLKASYLTGDSDRFSYVIDELISDDEVSVDALILSTKGRLKVSKRNEFYLEAGILRYEIDVRGRSDSSDDGIDVMAGVGWEYRFDAGIGINLDYQYAGYGDSSTRTLNTGISFAF